MSVFYRYLGASWFVYVGIHLIFINTNTSVRSSSLEDVCFIQTFRAYNMVPFLPLVIFSLSFFASHS